MPATLPTRGSAPALSEDRATYLAFLFFMVADGAAALTGLVSLLLL